MADPDARLYRKGPGREATLAYLGQVLLDNRNGFVANVCVTAATGTAEREAATWMLDASAPSGSQQAREPERLRDELARHKGVYREKDRLQRRNDGLQRQNGRLRRENEELKEQLAAERRAGSR